MAKVRNPAPKDHSFATVGKWSEGLGRLRATFDGDTGPFPKTMVERAEGLYSELLDSTTERCLLHGDLHHANLLSATREPWLAIDPQGVVGDPAYEAAPFLRNNLSGRTDPAGAVARRARILAETLAVNPGRLLDWARAESVLSAWWHYEDNDPAWRQAIPLAEVIESAAAHSS
jgi:streptomycin 6-kinase